MLDKIGIIDGTSSFGIGFVPWRDVRRIRIGRVRPGKRGRERGPWAVMLFVDEPQSYVGSASLLVRVLWMKPYWRRLGTPLVIHVMTLDLVRGDLAPLIQHYSGISVEMAV